MSVIFDFDGVVVDSMSNNFLAWRNAMAEQNVIFDRRGYFLLEGARPIEVAQALLPTGDHQAAVESKEQHFARGPKSAVYPGIPEFLTQLKERGFKLGLVSGGGRTRVQASLAQHGLQHIFDVLVTADDVQQGKPNPEPFLKAMSELDEECKLVIENAPLGIRSAKAAGLKVVAVGSTLEASDLSEADYFCANHKELYTLVNQLLENQT